jgi:hypothetical protein
LNSDVATEGAKAAPPLVVTALTMIQGWDLNHWVAAATLGYIGLQAAYLVWKWRQQVRHGLGDDA